MIRRHNTVWVVCCGRWLCQMWWMLRSVSRRLLTSSPLNCRSHDSLSCLVTGTSHVYVTISYWDHGTRTVARSCTSTLQGRRTEGKNLLITLKSAVCHIENNKTNGQSIIFFPNYTQQKYRFSVFSLGGRHLTVRGRGSAPPPSPPPLRHWAMVDWWMVNDDSLHQEHVGLLSLKSLETKTQSLKSTSLVETHASNSAHATDCMHVINANYLSNCKYCNEYFCLFVCLCVSIHISQKPHSRTLPNF